MTWRAIAGFRLVTQMPDRLVPFYRALGFTAVAPHPIAEDEMAMLGVAGTGTRIVLTLGGTNVDLDTYSVAGDAYPRSIEANSRAFQHLAIPSRDVDASWQRARAAGAQPISRAGPVQLPASSGGVTAVKFRDPEGHPLELIGLPASDGDGINHSAIVATDVAASLAFYQARGLIERGTTLNVGTAQDDLDHVDAASVDVLPLYPSIRSPHLELLHYRTPGAFTPLPAVNDVAATRIVWHADHAGLERDPDGHLHQLEARRAP